MTVPYAALVLVLWEFLVDLFARATEGATWRNLARVALAWGAVLTVAYAAYAVYATVTAGPGG